jgi:hypothetical protein
MMQMQETRKEGPNTMVAWCAGGVLGRRKQNVRRSASLRFLPLDSWCQDMGIDSIAIIHSLSIVTTADNNPLPSSSLVPGKMVAGKNSPQALAKAASNPRLPPLPRLRVRRPNQGEANPCIGLLSSVLGCWASQGYTAQGCAALEQQLRVCMDAKVSPGLLGGYSECGRHLTSYRKRKRRRRAISIINYRDSIRRLRVRTRGSEQVG